MKNVIQAMRDFRFSQRRYWRTKPSRTLHRANR